MATMVCVFALALPPSQKLVIRSPKDNQVLRMDVPHELKAIAFGIVSTDTISWNLYEDGDERADPLLTITHTKPEDGDGFQWKINNVSEGKYLITATSAMNANLFHEHTVFLRNPASFQLVQPSENTKLRRGESLIIQWKYTNLNLFASDELVCFTDKDGENDNEVELQLMKQQELVVNESGGCGGQEKISTRRLCDGFFSWHVPFELPADTYRIRATTTIDQAPFTVHSMEFIIE